MNSHIRLRPGISGAAAAGELSGTSVSGAWLSTGEEEEALEAAEVEVSSSSTASSFVKVEVCSVACLLEMQIPS